MINKIKKLKKFITCNFPTTEDERLQHAEVAGYNKAIDDVCNLLFKENDMKNIHDIIKDVKIVNKLEVAKEMTLNSEDDVSLRPVFEINEKVVWDSHSGYEIGYFLGEGVLYETYLIDMKTGVVREPCSHSKNEVFRYSDELIDKLFKKYGYEKRFW